MVKNDHYEWWKKHRNKPVIERFVNQDEVHEWLELAQFAMESGVSKEAFRAFLQVEAQNRGKFILR